MKRQIVVILLSVTTAACLLLSGCGNTAATQSLTGDAANSSQAAEKPETTEAPEVIEEPTETPAVTEEPSSTTEETVSEPLSEPAASGLVAAGFTDYVSAGTYPLRTRTYDDPNEFTNGTVEFTPYTRADSDDGYETVSGKIIVTFDDLEAVSCGCSRIFNAGFECSERYVFTERNLSVPLQLRWLGSGQSAHSAEKRSKYV